MVRESGSFGPTLRREASSGVLTVLHHLAGGAADGSYPLAGLVRDKTGTLYGVTYYSGAFGQGTIFKVKGSTFTLPHSFNCGSDGCYPVGALMEDTKGNLYGTAFNGGPLGSGTVWKLIP
jgi:uncharacterized repeat protein (TIGR03803 family)